MKKAILVFLIFAGIATCHAQNDPTEFIISGGLVTDDVRATMQRNVFEFFKACQTAAATKAKAPALSTKMLTKQTIDDVKSLWECSPFMCPLMMVEENLLKTPNGYEVRNIPIIMLDADKDADKELVVSLDEKGVITGIDIAIESRMYNRIMAEGTVVGDFARRQMITNFVEVFRTAYNKKDIKYLEQVYSDDALIITGRIVKQKQSTAAEQQAMYGEHIEYVKHDKRTYLTNLRKAFAAAKYINVKFSDIEVVRHPKHPDIYGVTLRQDWTTSTYHDDGFVFLMIDFADEAHPEIHVRTWQPAFKNGKELTKEEIFGLGSFQIANR